MTSEFEKDTLSAKAWRRKKAEEKRDNASIDFYNRRGYADINDEKDYYEDKKRKNLLTPDPKTQAKYDSKARRERATEYRAKEYLKQKGQNRY